MEIDKAFKFLKKGDSAEDQPIQGFTKKEREISLKKILDSQKHR